MFTLFFSCNISRRIATDCGDVRCGEFSDEQQPCRAAVHQYISKNYVCSSCSLHSQVSSFVISLRKAVWTKSPIYPTYSPGVDFSFGYLTRPPPPQSDLLTENIPTLSMDFRFGYLKSTRTTTRIGLSHGELCGDFACLTVHRKVTITLIFYRREHKHK